MLGKDPKESAFRTGTTTLGLVFKDGVVLSSESRVSDGFYVASKTGQKVLKITDQVGMTIAGLVADAQAMVDQAKALSNLYYYDKGRTIPVRAVSKIISNILFGQRPYYMGVSLLIGGVDDTGPHLFSLDAAGSLIEDKYVSTGSGSVIAYGVLEDAFKEDLTEEEALRIAVRAVWSAMQRDVFSGNKLNLAVVTKEGFKHIADEKIETYVGELKKQ